MPKVYINNQDSEKGVEGDPNFCVVACALKRKLKRKVEVCADEIVVYKKNNKTVDYYAVPSKRMRKQIIAYDSGKGFPAGHYSYAINI